MHDTIIVISTVVSALSAVAVAVLTYKLVNITKKYVELTEVISSTNSKMVEEQHRPFVVVSIVSENLTLRLSVKNVGNRPAKNVEIEFTPDLDIVIQKIGESDEPLFESKRMLKQSFIPPNYDFRNMLYHGASYFKRQDAGEHVFDVVVKYSDEQEKNYQESYTIDFKTFYFLKHAVDFSDNHHLGETHKEIKSLREALVKAINNIKTD